MSAATNHLEGRTVIVTGAAGGFGRLLVEKAAALGANVGACDIDADALADLAGERVEIGTVDVTDLAAMRAFADRVVDRFGAIDVMINNAGVMPLAFYADHEAAAGAWDRCIDINIKGVLHGIIAVHDQMISQGRGQVVNISSVYGNAPVGGAAVYGATKAAVNVLSESLRQESLGKIKVTTVRPTGVPGTGLAGGIINVEAVNPVLGANKDQFYDKLAQVFSENPPARLTDEDSIELAALAPEQIADQVIHAINQPWGISIADITIRASNDDYIV
ncbi:MAG: SDR family oxidoreductase [Candidatus Microthrix sp.]|nr:SDR family oxidoreductase [Candidatus Microthrix sp.]